MRDYRRFALSSVSAYSQSGASFHPSAHDKVFYNGEGHWDPALNKFNVIRSGVYLFSYHITVRNRPVRAVIDSLYGQDMDQASNVTLLHLSEGDRVWLETLRDWNGVFYSREEDSTFSGFLVHPVSKDKLAAENL